MKIRRRLSTGWSEPTENKSKTHCDKCWQKLWEGPGGAYCNGNWEGEDIYLKKMNVINTQLADEFLTN